MAGIRHLSEAAAARNAESTVVDAINQIARWTTQGLEFYVCAQVLDAQPGQRRRYLFHVNAPGQTQYATDFSTRQPMAGVIDTLLRWQQAGTRFDVRLLKRRRSDRMMAVAPGSSRVRASADEAPVSRPVLRLVP